MASGGGKYAIGRFFVSQSPQTSQSQTDNDLSRSTVTHSVAKGSRKAQYVGHVGHKRVKKFMPLSYPEPTIQEETSPNEGEVHLEI